MGHDLVEIEPGELRFPFELKKQSSCRVHLINKSNDYVAFKVKTTSPKKYCVRPNTGVIPPRATCDFTVTMQAQQSAPPDMQSKDKFLVQSTVVPYATAETDLTPSCFSKEDGKYIEERKLKVVLISVPVAPKVHPHNGISVYVDTGLPVSDENFSHRKERTFLSEETPAFSKEAPPLQDISGSFKDSSLFLKDSSFKSSNTFKASNASFKASPKDDSAELKAFPPAPGAFSTSTPILKDLFNKDKEIAAADNDHLSQVADDVDALKAKLHIVESKLEEAENVIMKLREDSQTTIQESHKLQQEMILLRRKAISRNQDGFPLLFVVYVALLGVALGHLFQF